MCYNEISKILQSSTGSIHVWRWTVFLYLISTNFCFWSEHEPPDTYVSPMPQMAPLAHMLLWQVCGVSLLVDENMQVFVLIESPLLPKYWMCLDFGLGFVSLLTYSFLNPYPWCMSTWYRLCSTDYMGHSWTRITTGNIKWSCSTCMCIPPDECATLIRRLNQVRMERKLTRGCYTQWPSLIYGMSPVDIRFL